MSALSFNRRTLPRSGRLMHFMRLARAERAYWHRSESAGSNRRVVEFCRIARGRTA